MSEYVELLISVFVAGVAGGVFMRALSAVAGR